MTAKKNKKQIGDTLYTFTNSFRRGARDYWNGVSFHANPYRSASQAGDDWNDGHVLASSREVTKEEIGMGKPKRKALMPAPSATRCNRCRDKAVIRISATDLQGTVLDVEIVCRECAKKAGFEVGS